MIDRPRLVRRASAALLVVWLAVVAGAFVQRQLRRTPPPPPSDLPSETDDGGERPLRVHKGFVYSDTLGVQPNFRIAAEETVEFASGWVELRRVEVWLYREGRVAYGLVAAEARFNQSRRELHVVGQAQISLASGVAVRAAGFTLKGPERQLISDGAVTFAGPGWGGVAGGLTCSLVDDTFMLEGGVSVSAHGAGEGGSAQVMLAPTMLYERRHEVVRFPKGLTLLRGGLRAHAPSGAIGLTGPEGAVQRADLDAPVEIEGVGTSGETVEAEAGATSAEAIGDGRWRIAARASPRSGWVSARWQQPDRSWREFTTWRLEGEGTPSAWQWLEGNDRTCLVDTPLGIEARAIEATRIRLDFDQGQPNTGLARGFVRVQEGARVAEGGELQFSVRTRKFTLLPEPGGRVRAAGAEGELRCGRADGDEDGAIVAQGQVTGVVFGSVLGGPQETPANFAAEQVSMSRAQDRVVLQGDARLWQRERLVRADRLEYVLTSGVLRGEGDALTAARPESEGGDRGLVRITARAFEYDRAGSVATYEGDVMLEDATATSHCQRLDVEFDEHGQIREGTLLGGVQVTERASRRELLGERARVSPEGDSFEVWGKPAIAREPSGNQVKAERLLWRPKAQTLSMLGGGDSPTETIYHPARPMATVRPAATPRPTRLPRGPHGGRRTP